MFYRGNADLPVSFIVAFLIPWVLASLVHYVDTIMTIVCFFAVTGSILVSYAASFVIYSEVVHEAIYFETNFRLSLKQMYDGDRRKDTKEVRNDLRSASDKKLEDTILPIANEYVMPRGDGSYRGSALEGVYASTADMTSLRQRTI